MSETVQIRVARPADADAIAEILVEGLGAKLIPAFGVKAVAATRAIAAVGLAVERPWYRVATRGGNVVGVVHLDLGEDGRTPMIGALSAAVGPLTTARAALVLGALNPPVPVRGEALIEELAVAPAARRSGVASALLSACIDEAAGAGGERLILQVTADNAPACALYRRHGFVVRRSTRWWLRRRLFRSPGALIMERPIDRPGGGAPVGR